MPPNVNVDRAVVPAGAVGLPVRRHRWSPRCGGVVLEGKPAGGAALPARSVQRADTDASALSGAEYVTAGHVSTPEVASVPHERVRDGPVVPITGVRASIRRRGPVTGRRGRVVLQRERERSAPVAGVVGARPADRRGRAVRPAVGRARAPLHAGGRVGAGKAMSTACRTSRSRWLRAPGRPPVTVGPVASYLRACPSGALMLPALSVQVPGSRGGRCRRARRRSRSRTCRRPTAGRCR